MSPGCLKRSDIYIGPKVTGCSIVGARLGNESGKGHEDYGFYYDEAHATGTTAPTGPWYVPPVIILSNVEALGTLSTPIANSAVKVGGPDGYSKLAKAGYFDPLAEYAYAKQAFPDDPNSANYPTPFPHVMGFNWYDLSSIRDRQWIDVAQLTGGACGAGNDVVTPDGKDPTTYMIDPANFTKLVHLVSSQHPEGVVLYLPAGHFNGDFTSFTPIAYQLPPESRSGLVIDRGNVQLVGDGRDVTIISNCTKKADNTDTAVELTGNTSLSPTQQGVFGLSIYYNKRVGENEAGYNPGAAIYHPAFLIHDTAQVRLADASSNWPIAPTVLVRDSKDCELYSLFAKNECANMGAWPPPPSQPQTVLSSKLHRRDQPRTSGSIRSAGSSTARPPRTRLRLATWRPNNSIPSVSLVAWNGPGSTTVLTWARKICSWPSRMPGGRPKTCRVYGCRLTLAKSATVSILRTAMEPSISSIATGPACEDLCRAQLRCGDEVSLVQRHGCGTNLEGIDIESGADVQLVNCLDGINYCLVAGTPGNNHPKSGLYLGSHIRPRQLGGNYGWLMDAFYSRATANKNAKMQDYGMVVSNAISPLLYYGVNTVGNKIDGVKTY